MFVREAQHREHAPCGLETRLYALWEDRALTGARLRTLDGQDVFVLSRGVRNDGPGPDYRDAVVIIAGRLAVGAVEMHRVEADWFAHGHDRDPAYERVILHVLGAAPARQSLALPSVLADAIAIPIANTAPVDDERLRRSRTDISRELLLDAAWSRLLRRVTEIVRTDVDLPIGARIRRALIVRLFDCLGYSANRTPMRTLGQCLVADGAFDGGHRGATTVPERARSTGFDALSSRLFGLGGCDATTIRELGSGFMSEARIESILSNRPRAIAGLRWNRATRPANVPERRLWAAARLLAEIACAGKAERLIDRVAGGATWYELERDLVVRLGAQSFIGSNRAAEIVMNALLPVALAVGIVAGSTTLIERACRLYRTAPAQQSNRTIRQIEGRYLGGRTLSGGFWQQGAIEHYQRYLLPDRSALSFLADKPTLYRAA